MSEALRILLIEDDAYKAKRICTFLGSLEKQLEVSVERSVSTGLSRLMEPTKPDVLLLDMSLSTFDVGPRETGGRPQNFGGITVLEHMTRRGIDIPVLIVTQFESFPQEDGKELSLSMLREKLLERFRERLRGVVYYSSRETAWEHELQAFIDDNIRAAQ